MMTNETTNEPAGRTRDGVRPEPQASGPFSRGQVLAGAYEVGAVLGAGGMGVVYAAHDLLLERMVAIKAPLLPDFADSLAREAQAMAAVHHPNLVTIHAAGREGDVGFIVMERLFGMTLEDRIAEAWEAGRPIPLEEALAQLAGVTDALTAIHGAGAAHRDVKSGNVMLTGRRVVLTDFGLATPEVVARWGTPLAGSIDYMAPELIMGSVKHGQGPLVDLYALGVVLFEAIAGRRPFGGDTVNAVLAAHVHRPAPDLRSFRADVPAELAMLVGDLLAKAPEERPASAEAVLWQLAAIRADLPHPSGQVAPRLSVLIVDDDPAIGAVLKRNLEWTLPRLAADVVTEPHRGARSARAPRLRPRRRRPGHARHERRGALHAAPRPVAAARGRGHEQLRLPGRRCGPALARRAGLRPQGRGVRPAHVRRDRRDPARQVRDARATVARPRDELEAVRVDERRTRSANLPSPSTGPRRRATSRPGAVVRAGGDRGGAVAADPGTQAHRGGGGLAG